MAASVLPPGKWQFFDLNGDPLVAGTVTLYYPGGTTPKDSWQDFEQETLNANPLTLDARGEAIIWGLGRYRMLLKDSLGNTIWDRETFATQPLQAASVIMTWTGEPDGANAWLGGCYIDRAINFPADLEGSGGLTPKTAATGDYLVTIKAGGITIGTALWDLSEAEWVFSTVGNTAKSVPEGSYLDFYGPASPDATIAHFGLTLKGSLAE